MSKRKVKIVGFSESEVDNLQTLYELNYLGTERTDEVYAWLKGKRPSRSFHAAMSVVGVRGAELLRVIEIGDLVSENARWIDIAERLLGRRLMKYGVSEYFVRYLDALSIARQTPKSRFERNLYPAYFGYLVHLEDLIGKKSILQKPLTFQGITTSRDVAEAKSLAEDYFVQSDWEARLKEIAGSG